MLLALPQGEVSDARFQAVGGPKGDNCSAESSRRAIAKDSTISFLTKRHLLKLLPATEAESKVDEM